VLRVKTHDRGLCVLVIPPGGRRRGTHDVASTEGPAVVETSLDDFLREMRGLLGPVC
jgi:hypothetical protein